MDASGNVVGGMTLLGVGRLFGLLWGFGHIYALTMDGA